MSETRRWLLRLGGIAAALILWEIAGRILGERLLAPPSTVFPQYVEMLRDGSMLGTLGHSLQQMMIAYVLALVIGIPLGIAMGRSRVCDALVHPWVSIFVVTSEAALVPLFIVLLGTGLWFRVSIVFITSVWYVVLASYHGARGLERRYVDVGRAFAAAPLQIFWKVMLPALFPYLITGARLGFIHAIRAMIVAEMFIIVGYGGLIYNAGLATSTAPLLGLLFTLMLVGIVASVVLRWIGRRIAPWYDDHLAAT